MLREHTWKPTALKNDFAYFLICNRKAWDCGGSRKILCSTYYDHNSSTFPPSDKVSNLGKKEKKKAKQSARRKGAATTGS